MIACCGKNCSACGAYIATQSGNPADLNKVARIWSEFFKAKITPEMIICDGCLANGRKSFYCTDLCEIRPCCTEKALDNCAFCDKFGCDDLQVIFKIAPSARDTIERIRAER